LEGDLADQLEEALLEACLFDSDTGVRDDARNAIEQLENPVLEARLQNHWSQ
jgi:hypothetical protein